MLIPLSSGLTPLGLRSFSRIDQPRADPHPLDRVFLLGKLGGVVKAFQNEVDKLTLRAQFAEAMSHAPIFPTCHAPFFGFITRHPPPSPPFQEAFVELYR